MRKSKSAAANTNLVANASEATRDKATEEIFGGTLRIEISKAKTAIEDFAKYNARLRKDSGNITTELLACTKSSQVARIMCKVRHEYL